MVSFIHCSCTTDSWSVAVDSGWQWYGLDTLRLIWRTDRGPYLVIELNSCPHPVGGTGGRTPICVHVGLRWCGWVFYVLPDLVTTFLFTGRGLKSGTREGTCVLFRRRTSMLFYSAGVFFAQLCPRRCRRRLVCAGIVYVWEPGPGPPTGITTRLDLSFYSF